MAIPGGPGPTKPKDPVRDRPQDPGHGTPPVSGSGGGGGSHSPYRDGTGQSPPRSGGGGAAGAYQGTYRPPPAWVIRRQQILRRAGLNVGVDGVWGPVSQHAWAQFTKGISGSARAILRSGEFPHGMVPYKGRLVSKVAADAARAIANARLNATALDAHGMMNQVRAARGIPGQVPVQLAQPARTGEDVHLAEQSRQQLEREALGQQSASEMATAVRLFGSDGYKTLARQPLLARRRISMNATPADLLNLIGQGILDVQRPGDVRTIQEAAKRAGADVKVSGIFDEQTARGLESAFAIQRAHDIKTGIEGIRKTYFAPGIGQVASLDVLGHEATPEEFFAILQRGGPQAQRLIVRAQNLYEWSAIPLDQYRQQEAQKAYAAKYGTWADGPLTRTQEVALLPHATYLWQAHNLNDLQVRYLVARNAEKQRELLARASTGSSFWGDAWNTVTGALGWSAHTTGISIASVRVFVYENVQSATDTLDAASGGNLGWLLNNAAVQDTARQLAVGLGGGGVLNTALQMADIVQPLDAKRWQHKGFITPHEAWIQGRVTYDQWRAENPWSAVAYESVIDPLNFIGGLGPADRALTLSSKLLTTSGRIEAGANRADRAITAADLAVALHVPHLLEGGADVMEAIATIRLRAGIGFDMTRMGRSWRFVTRGRGLAIKQAQRMLEADVARGFRNWRAEARMIATSTGVPDAHLAASFDASVKALAAVPAKLKGDIAASAADMAGHFHAVAPELHSFFSTLGTSLYRSADRADGELSQAGRVIAAAFTERANRVIIDSLSRDLAAGDAEKLAEYVANRGTAYAGLLHPDLIERANFALNEFRGALYDQILPHLADVTNAHNLSHLWDAEGHLVDEMSKEVEAAMARLTGYDYKAFLDPKMLRAVVNPMHGRSVSAALMRKYVQIEIDVRTRRLYEWAAHREWLARGDAEAIDRIRASVVKRKAEIQREVADAWKQGADGLWTDTRATLDVPEPYARPGTLEGGDPFFHARTDTFLSSQLDKMLRAALSTGPAGLPEALGDAGWTKYAMMLERRKILSESAKGFLTPAYLRQQGLYLEALGSSQRRWARGIYRSMTFGMQTWKFASLPGHFAAYTIRNEIDNYTKMMIDGHIDPRRWFNPDGHSIFDRDFRALTFAARVMDDHFRTNIEQHLESLTHYFWANHRDLLDKVLGAHNIPIPEELYTQQRTFYENLVREQDPTDLLARRPLKREATLYERFTDRVWDLAGSRPESFAKRAVYVKAYGDALAAGRTEAEAWKTAMDSVDRILFDYSDVTVLEDQLKVLVPFILFWRKNATFWAHVVTDKPWFIADAQRVFDAHNQSNGNLPDWMQRYTNVGIFGGALRSIGADWLADWAKDAYADPLQYSSVTAFYRSFKNSNPLLPADQQGWAFVAPIADAFQNVGLGMNPFLRTGGEIAGIFNRRSWVSIFPQTQLLQMFTESSFVMDRFGPNGSWYKAFGETGFNWEQVFQDQTLGRIGAFQWHTLTEQSFQHYVDLEIANQIAHGGKADRAKATEKIRGWLMIQGIVAFVGGLYARHITDTDIQFYSLQQKLRETNGDVNVWAGLTPAQQEAYQLEAFTLHKKNHALIRDPEFFDHYRVALEGARTFFQIDDWKQRQQFLRANPDILGIVDPIVGGRIPDRQAWMRDQLLILRGDEVQKLYYDVVHNPEIDTGVQSAAYDQLVTPALKEFWARNDTPQQVRDRQVRGAYASYMNRAQNTYFAIPEADQAARDAYLRQHPELSAWWVDHNSMADDWAGVIGEANATFRDVYFRIVDAGDWDAADAYLKAHSFIFDFTSAEGRVTPEGKWVPRTEAQKAYAAIAPELRALYALPHSMQDEYVATHPLLRVYFQRYGAKGTSIFGPSEMGTYFPGGLSQHAKDYLAVKALIDAFFSLPDGAAKERYLTAHPELRAYFAKYAHQQSASRTARGGRNAAYWHHIAADPEIHARYLFWMRFFALPPDERPKFVHDHAADAGIFLYGSLSYDQQIRKEARWRRDAIALGLSPRAVVFAHIKPLMDIYFTLKSSADKNIFLQTNPELAYYFEHYAKHTGIPGDVVPLLNAYFALPPYSAERHQFVTDNPILERFFSSKASPHQKAIQNMVEAYFSLPFGVHRDEYLAAHPELAIWFDQRQAEHFAYSDISLAFNEADPRMDPFYAQYADIIPMDAIKRFELAWTQKHPADTGPRIDRAVTSKGVAETKARSSPATGAGKKAGESTRRVDRTPL